MPSITCSGPFIQHCTEIYIGYLSIISFSVFKNQHFLQAMHVHSLFYGNDIDRWKTVFVLCLFLLPLFRGFPAHVKIECTWSDIQILHLRYVKHSLSDKHSACIHLVAVRVFGASADMFIISTGRKQFFIMKLPEFFSEYGVDRTVRISIWYWSNSVVQCISQYITQCCQKMVVPNDFHAEMLLFSKFSFPLILVIEIVSI